MERKLACRHAQSVCIPAQSYTTLATTVAIAIDVPAAGAVAAGATIVAGNAVAVAG